MGGAVQSVLSIGGRQGGGDQDPLPHSPGYAPEFMGVLLFETCLLSCIHWLVRSIGLMILNNFGLAYLGDTSQCTGDHLTGNIESKKTNKTKCTRHVCVIAMTRTLPAYVVTPNDSVVT